MCLGDIFGACLVPIAGCLKYICGAVALALIFCAGLVGLDFVSDWPIILILLACLLALIWFILTYCGGILERDDEGGYYAKQYELICETQIIVKDYELRHNYSSELADSCVQIDNAVLSTFYNQFLHVLIILLIFLIMTIWFVQTGARVGFVIGLLFGAGAMTLAAWGGFIFAGKSVSRALISGINLKHELFSFMYTSGFAVVMLGIACVYFFFLIVFFVFKQLQELKKDVTQEQLQIMGVHCCGYGMGVLLAALVYRESTSILARGLFNSVDGLIKMDKNLSFSNPYISQPTKVLYVIQNILATQIVNLLDSVICIAILAISGFVILGNSKEVADDDFTWKCLLAPVIFFCVNVLCSVIVQMFRTIIWQDDVISFTAWNCRLQVIITHCVSLIIFALMPMVTILKEFSITGIDGPDALKKEKISIAKITWSCIVGQITNLILICVYEWMTTHGCSPVQNLAYSSSDRVPFQNINYANYLSGLGLLIVVVTMGIMSAIVFSLAGYAGLMAGAAGFIINVVIILPIFYVGAISADGYKLCCASHVTPIVTDRLHKMTWAARNYMIYLKTTNAGTACLLAFTFMGCALYVIKGELNPLFDFTGAFGLILGIGMAYLLKGMTIAAVINISKQYNLNIYEIGIAAEVAKLQRQYLQSYIDDKLMIALVWMYTIFIVDTFIMIVFGFFFGKHGSGGFLLGHSVACLFLMFGSIISGTSLKNSRYYNEEDDKVNKRSKLYNAYVTADMMGTVNDESTAIPLIVYLLYNVILITCLHTLFGSDGDLFAEKKE